MSNSIIKIQPIDFASVLKIADAQLGKSYITRKDLVRFSELDQILLLKQDATIAGFITWEVQFPKNTMSIINKKDKDQIFIKSIVTHSTFQKQGIGSQLVSHIIQKYNEHHIALLGWKANGHCNIEKLCLSLGFSCTGEMKDIWKKECESGAFDCPEYDCECRCSALVFEK
jgi:GNAT superfamily N-acetyltransferase